MILGYDAANVQDRSIAKHEHDFVLQHQRPYLKIEGTKGAIKIRVGLSLDYPKDPPSKLGYIFLGKGQKKWEEIKIKGKWFSDVFIGTMAVLQRHVLDKISHLPHSTEDAYNTMRLVESAYVSSEQGGVYISTIQYLKSG